MTPIKSWVDGLGPKQARSLACLLGALSAFAMPPVYQIYILVPAFSMVLWMTEAAKSRWHAFVVGWWFGAGFFAAGLYWVSFALLVDAAKFGWLIPIAILAFGFGFGIFPAMTTFVTRLVPGNFTAKALVFSATWAFFEWVRSWLFTGFPWNPMGSVWAFSDALTQGMSVTGVFGMSLLAVFAATMPGAMMDVHVDAKGKRISRILTVGIFICIGFVALWGENRLQNASNQFVEGVRLRLIQPNIAQAQKWTPNLRQSHMVTQLQLGTAPPLAGDPAPTHVIWGETAAPFFIADQVLWREMVGKYTPAGGLTVLGAPAVVRTKDPGDQNAGLSVTNSLLAIDPLGNIQAQYDKFHLVPFGEYVPLKSWLPLERITQGLGSFIAGDGLKTINLKGLPPVSPLICYEIIFPGQVTDGSGSAEWILNLTNDGWYGRTAGPHQHFVSARLRAVESGLPVVRVSGSGISAIIDGFGRPLVWLPLGEKGFVDGDLPQPVSHPTLYSRFGNALALILMTLVGIAGLIMGLKRRPLTHA